MDIEIICTSCALGREDRLCDWKYADQPFLLGYRSIFSGIGRLCDLLYCAGTVDEPRYPCRNGSGSLSGFVCVDMDIGKG